MSSFEEFFQDSGMSYTLSKLLPYLVMPLIGLIVWSIAKRWMKKGWLKLVTFFVFLLLPLGLYLGVHPIFEGDFANNPQEIAKTGELKSIEATKLVVITIPGCRFCMESIGRMRAFKLRNPKAKIEYRVCHKDPRAVKDYEIAAKGDFKIRLAENPEEMMKIAGNAFPAFVLVKKNSADIWSNDNFGVGALDEVAARFQ